MPQVLTRTVYRFDELDDRAKENARDWFRGDGPHDDWYDAVYEDAATCGDILGIQLRQKPVKLMNGSTRYDPAIFFTGFSSQGDGACFEGDYQYAKGAAKAIRAHAPQDTELHRIADALQAVQRENFYHLTAVTKHRGHYYHSGCMSVDVDGNEARQAGYVTIAEEVTQLMRDFAYWIYRQLEREHDYQQSNEVVDENIRANEYQFDEHGHIT